MKREFSFLGVSLALAVATANGQQVPADTAIAAGRLSKEQQLEDVVVSATRADAKTPMAYTNFGVRDIGRNNYGQDITYLVSQTPSVVYTSDAGTGIGYTRMRVRGTDINRINITANGIPLNDAESHEVFWVNMPDFASSLQNIQVQRGVGTSTNGAAAFGASLNMQTELLQPNAYAEYSGSAGSFGTFKNTVKAGTGLMKNKVAVDLRLSKITSDGYVDRASVDLQSYYLSAGYYGTKSMLKLVTFSGLEKTYQAWDGVPAAMLATHRTYNPCGEYYAGNDTVPSYYDNQTDNYHQTHYQLMFSHQLSAAWSLQAALHYTRGLGYYEDYKDDDDLARYLVPARVDADGNAIEEADVIRQKWLDNDFYGATFSLRYTAKRLQATLGGAGSYYDGRHYGKVLWVENYSTLPYEFYRGTGAKQDYNLFAKVNVEVLRNLNVYADMQFRFIDYRIGGRDDRQHTLDVYRTYPFFNPKLGALYTLNEQHEFFLSFAVANREPNRNNFVEAGPNETPTFETLYDYELGYTLRHDWLSASINGYFMDYENQLILSGKISEIGEALTTNIPNSYRAGVELTLGAAICKWLRWDGNVSLSRNKIRSFTEYVDDWDSYPKQVAVPLGTTDIAFSPDIVANSIFSFAHRGFTAGWRSYYVGRQYIDNTSSRDRSIAPYFVNNLQAGYSHAFAGITFALDVQCNNLFNEQYETNAWVYSYFYSDDNGTRVRGKDAGYFPQAGRNWMVRLTVKF